MANNGDTELFRSYLSGRENDRDFSIDDSIGADVSNEVDFGLGRSLVDKYNALLSGSVPASPSLPPLTTHTGSQSAYTAPSPARLTPPEHEDSVLLHTSLQLEDITRPPLPTPTVIPRSDYTELDAIARTLARPAPAPALALADAASSTARDIELLERTATDLGVDLNSARGRGGAFSREYVERMQNAHRTRVSQLLDELQNAQERIAQAEEHAAEAEAAAAAANRATKAANDAAARAENDFTAKLAAVREDGERAAAAAAEAALADVERRVADAVASLELEHAADLERQLKAAAEQLKAAERNAADLVEDVRAEAAREAAAAAAAAAAAEAGLREEIDRLQEELRAECNACAAAREEAVSMRVALISGREEARAAVRAAEAAAAQAQAAAADEVRHSSAAHKDESERLRADVSRATELRSAETLALKRRVEQLEAALADTAARARAQLSSAAHDIATMNANMELAQRLVQERAAAARAAGSRAGTLERELSLSRDETRLLEQQLARMTAENAQLRADVVRLDSVVYGGRTGRR